MLLDHSVSTCTDECIFPCVKARSDMVDNHGDLLSQLQILMPLIEDNDAFHMYKSDKHTLCCTDENHLIFDFWRELTLIKIIPYPFIILKRSYAFIGYYTFI